MAEEIRSILRDLGMTDYETRIYSALLELGKATSGEILKKAELKTGKIYEILDSLEKKGLASSVVENGVRRFSPADPRRIKDWLEEKKAKIDEQEKSIQKIIPDILQRISTIKGKVNIEIFTGLKGLKTAFMKEADYYNSKNTLYVFGVLSSKSYSKKEYDFFIYNIYPKREQTKVKLKKIMSKGAKVDIKDIEKHAEIRYLDYFSAVTINVIDKLTTISINSEEKIVISIESDEVAKSFIQQFEVMWRQAKR